MSSLGELIHDHPFLIILAGRERERGRPTIKSMPMSIHADVFPFPDRNIQRLQQFGRP
jgi:hypothetical protein